MYKLDGVPLHNAEAVRQFTEKRENHLRQQALAKRKEMREKIMKKKSKSEPKKTNDQNKIKTNITNVRSIKKKIRKKYLNV